MYEAPKLVRFGKFRDLTLQVVCDPNGGPTKSFINYDAFFPTGGQDDGCPTVRS